MQVIQYSKYGTASQLRLTTQEKPRPKAHQLLVRVSYSSVNPIDWKLRQGMMKFILPLRFPVIPGFDVAGEVVEIGSKVSGFSVGDKVFARLDSLSGGASAEFAVVGQKAAAKIPENLKESEAAAAPLAALTALQSLKKLGKIRKDSKVLINGASGGVGHYAVQIAKAEGAHVTAVCSGKNVEFIRDLGADRVIDYTKSDILENGESFDIIVDLIVNKKFSFFKGSLTKNGVYVAAIPTPGILARMASMPLYSRKRVHFVMVKPDGEDLAYIADLFSNGNLRTTIDSVYTLDNLEAAHERSESGRVRGKVVVEICKDCAEA